MMSARCNNMNDLILSGRRGAIYYIACGALFAFYFLPGVPRKSTCQR